MIRQNGLAAESVNSEGLRVNAMSFEIDACARCCGSGSYSFNLMHGSMCYGCHGSGLILTNRGSAARQFYLDSLKRPVADIKPGDSVRIDAKFRRVVSIGPGGSFSVSANGERVELFKVQTAKIALHEYPDAQLMSVRDEAERRAKLDAALAYQATLPKNYKPAKR